MLARLYLGVMFVLFRIRSQQITMTSSGSKATEVDVDLS